MRSIKNQIRQNPYKSQNLMKTSFFMDVMIIFLVITERVKADIGSYWDGAAD